MRRGEHRVVELRYECALIWSGIVSERVRLYETASKIATNGACTNDQNLHDVVLVLSAAVPRIDFTRSAEDDPSSDSP